jgi:anti-anti-sigma factor
MTIAESPRTLVVRDLGSLTGASPDDPTLVWLQGEHDLSSVNALSEALSRAIADDDRDVIVDLSRVEFMGAATLGVLLRARQDLLSRSRALTLRAPSQPARRVLDACGVDSVA